MRLRPAAVSAVVLVAVGVSLAVLLPAAKARPLADPIIGYWNFSGGVIQVAGGPTSFTGVVVKATRFSSCTHPVGEVIWRITKQGSGYVGTHQYFDSSGSCVPGSGGPGKSTWTIADSGGHLILRQCSASPSSGSTQCDDLTRAKPVKPPTPKPKPKPTPAPAKWDRLSLSYEIPARFGLKKKNGLIDYFTYSFEVEPDEWTALITVKGPGGASCDPNAKYAWKIGGDPNVFKRVGACEFAFEHFLRLGDFRVNLITTNGNRKGVGEVRVKIEDFLIVGLGDSNGSGEGNPDIPGLAKPVWEDFRCHRSANSYQALTALALEDATKLSSVTFVHLACSGASIHQGLLAHYRGLNDPGGVALPAQVARMDTLIGRRKPDAVIISIGINDLGFGPLVAFCIEQNGCFARNGFDPNAPKKDLDEVIHERLGALVMSYDAVAARLAALGVDPKTVYLTEYPDPTHDSDGKLCDPLIHVTGHGDFTRTEVDWAYDNVLVPLNAAVAAAAGRHGWKLVKGAQQLFRRHGYCSEDPWIVQLTKALLSQGVFWKGLGAAKAGTLHANAEGHRIQARRVLAVLRANKITGQPR